MLTELQTIFLTCLLGPEDKTGFRKFCQREAKKAERLREPEKLKAREREQHHKHKEKRNARGRKWYANNQPHVLAYREENKEQRKDSHATWRKAHLAERAVDQQKYRDKFPGASQMRSRISGFLKGRAKNASTPELLGCEFDAFGWWIESQFRPGMTWENYGALWEVDHIVPLSWFDQEDLLWQHKAFHFTNTQPLWKTENRAKGNRYVVR